LDLFARLHKDELSTKIKIKTTLLQPEGAATGTVAAGGLCSVLVFSDA